jgi:hypothetical protein
VRHYINRLAVALLVALGAAMPLGSGAAFAQTDISEKERQLRGVISEALPASRLPEIYADLRRVLQDAYLPSIRDAAKESTPGNPAFDAELAPHLDTIIAFMQYSLRAAEEAEPFLIQHRDEMIADLARAHAKYLSMPEIQALAELLNLPAMRKAFNAFYAASRLVTDYNYQELRSYYDMTAWLRELNLTGPNNPFTNPDGRTPAPELVGKAQSIINDFLGVSRIDEMVEKVIRFWKEVQQSTLLSEAQREEARSALERFEFFYNLQKSMVAAVGPSALAAIMSREQLEKLHLLVLAPVTAKSFGLMDEIVRGVTSFSKDDIASVQKFADDAEKKGLFKERSAEDKARAEAEMKALGETWMERIKGSLTPETRAGLERSLKEMEALGNDKGGSDDEDNGGELPAPGQRQL